MQDNDVLGDLDIIVALIDDRRFTLAQIRRAVEQMGLDVDNTFRDAWQRVVNYLERQPYE